MRRHRGVRIFCAVAGAPKRPRLAVGLVALTAGGLVGLTAASAAGVDDTTPPVFTQVPTASIPLGAVLRDWTCVGIVEHTLPIQVQMHAVDPESGIDHFEHYDGSSEPAPFAMPPYDTRSVTTDPADCFGGGRTSESFSAVNGVGLGTHWWRWEDETLRVVQDTATTDVRYKGSWSVSTFAGWSGGTTHKTRRRGADVRLKITIEAPSSADVTPRSSALGLVMAKGPDRGKAVVRLDGRRVGTVNTYSATRIHRSVVWRRTVSPGLHTLRVVNLATPGHPRIDVDAFVTTLKGSRELP